MSGLVNFHNPSLIVVGGSLAEFDDLIEGIRGGVHGRALTLATRTLKIEASRLGNAAGTAGAIHLAQRHLLSPDGLAGLLRKNENGIEAGGHRPADAEAARRRRHHRGVRTCIARR